MRALLWVLLLGHHAYGFQASVRSLARPVPPAWHAPRHTCLYATSDDSAGATLEDAGDAESAVAPQPGRAAEVAPFPTGGAVNVASGLLGPLKWERLLFLVAGQSLVGVAGLGLAWGLHGAPELALGPGFFEGGVGGDGALAILALGALASLPMLALIAAGEVFNLDERFPALAAVTEATKRTTLMALGKDFKPLAAGVGALLIALAAGTGEEVLFRGVMQEEIGARVGGPAGVAVASVVFGLLHAVTPVYALLATVAGAYFGWLYAACGHSVAVPAVAHAVYDWIALLLVHYEVTKGGVPAGGPEREAAQRVVLGEKGPGE